MERRIWPRDFPPLGALVALGVLGCAFGGMIGGLTGLQMGLAGGLVLGFVPPITRKLIATLRRPDGLPRFLARQLAAGLVAATAHLIDALAPLLAPFARATRLVLLPFYLAADVLAGFLGVGLARLGRQLGTPLGIANAAALVILVGDTAGVSAFSLAVPLGRIALLLALLVDLYEAQPSGRTADSRSSGGRAS
jgi:hypothetical protein